MSADWAQSVDRLGLKEPTDCFHYGAGCLGCCFYRFLFFWDHWKKIYEALHHGKLHRLCTFKISSDDLALFSRSVVYFLLKFWSEWVIKGEYVDFFSMTIVFQCFYSGQYFLVFPNLVASLADCKCWSLFRCCLINIFYILHDDLHLAWHVRTGFHNFEPVEGRKLRGKR